MSVNLNDYVAKDEEAGTWALRCPVTDGTCGGDGQSFTSTGWPTKATAHARLVEHVAEHKGEGVMSSLEEFRAKHGLTVDAEGVVTVKDL
jgi:hypothetical protein